MDFEDILKWEGSTFIHKDYWEDFRKELRFAMDVFGFKVEVRKKKEGDGYWVKTEKLKDQERLQEIYAKVVTAKNNRESQSCWNN